MKPKLWQAVVRIEGVQGANIGVVIPGWDSDKTVFIPLDRFAADVQKYVIPGNRFFAKAYLGAETDSEMAESLKDFEFQKG